MKRTARPEMHHQPGIDWTKAARLAMGINPDFAADTGLPDDNASHCDSGFCNAGENTIYGTSIKYPASVGQRPFRDASRDSFLRGGSQFKNPTCSGARYVVPGLWYLRFSLCLALVSAIRRPYRRACLVRSSAPSAKSLLAL